MRIAARVVKFAHTGRDGCKKICFASSVYCSIEHEVFCRFNHDSRTGVRHGVNVGITDKTSLRD